MPKLPIVSGKKTIKALEKLGFRSIRQKGSHVILKKTTESGDIGCTVPLHKELAVGTLQGILKQAKISNEEFNGCL
ncbi:MAG: type II toxin-antitoxin system HicA family toxin [Bacteroidota bacterium]|nr:type II toxin-antitoxin system HicA family toxin [Bacteroidota bacterium]